MQKMQKGATVVASDTYGTAMAFYSWLKQQVGRQHPVNDYVSSLNNRAALLQLTNLLMLRVQHGKVLLHGAPPNPWLSAFYPTDAPFLMRFTDFLGMNGAWQWHQKGIRFPGLDTLIHPYYGVYFPTRTEHLQLFDGWLAQQPPFRHAVDMGTGCGLLTHYLLKHGATRVTATDINPNALISLQADLARTAFAGKVTLVECSLFESVDVHDVDLLVFNPPWIPGQSSNTLDWATHYQPGFFNHFFDEAHTKLQPETLLLLLFSNFAELAGLTTAHPIRQELLQNRFELLSYLNAPLQQAPSVRKNWLSAIRKHERNELFVLRKK